VWSGTLGHTLLDGDMVDAKIERNKSGVGGSGLRVSWKHRIIDCFLIWARRCGLENNRGNELRQREYFANHLGIDPSNRENTKLKLTLASKQFIESKYTNDIDIHNCGPSIAGGIVLPAQPQLLTQENIPMLKHIESFFKSIFGHLAKWEPIAATAVKAAAPFTLELVTEIGGGADGAAAQSIVTEIQSDMALVYGFLNTPGTSMQKVVGTLNTITDNLSSLLTAGHIKDQATITKVTPIVSTISAAIQTIIALIPSGTTATT
jgi:hypothetical protein